MSPPRSLPEELVEEILLRFPPDHPARLVHAALVCKPWCAIVSGAGFRRRFREFHRTPPLLGFVSTIKTQGDDGLAAEFVATCSLPASRVHSRKGYVCVADARHGRVLLYRLPHAEDLPRPDVFTVWDPTTNEQQEVAVPPVVWDAIDWTSAVLCGAGSSCNHLDCQRGPFLIVYVCLVSEGYHAIPSEIVVCTYSSSTASWSKPISSNQLPLSDLRNFHFEEAVHVQSALYFGVTDHILKFDLESQEISWIQLPTACSGERRRYVLTTTDYGGVGVATIHESSKLYMWSREVDATWTQSRVIELKTLLPVHAVLASPRLLDITAGVISVKLNNVLFAIDLKTYEVIKEVSEASEIYGMVPYMSFYNPVALEAGSTGEGP